jgi:hypothetical protein
MEWRLAHGLEKLRSQVNAKWPARSKDSDGSIGDASHASRSSDHNPWVTDPPGPNVVTAIDITHDPRDGFDSYAFADMLLAKKDSRIKYVISNRRISSGSDGPSPWVWRKYTGTNPHDHHVHISIKSDKAHYDSISDWSIDASSMPAPNPASPAPVPVVTVGSSGPDVERLQRSLGCTITGKFAAASETEYALRLFQVRHGLDPDARCGPMTWAVLPKM